MTGSRRSARERCELGIGMFVEDGAYTVVSAAVSILVVLTLVFSSATAAWTMSRAGDVQVAADATALAGENVVAAYYTVATVMDACALSLGLAGFAVSGAGLAGMLVPGGTELASKLVDIGRKMLDARNDLCASASSGLSRLERSIPFLVAARGSSVCRAQPGKASGRVGVALAVPRSSDSSFPALEGEGVSTDGMEGAAQGLGEAASRLEAASRESSRAKEAAWLADCGSDGRCMWERASRLTRLPASSNPRYDSSLTWSPAVGIERARAYYAWRLENDRPEGGSVEARVDSAARRAFYAFAVEELAHAEYREDGGKVTCVLPRLPGGVAEVKGTRLYSDASWPTSIEPGGATLHYSLDCPGASGAAGPAAALSDLEAGRVRECPACRMGIDDVGRVPAASTSIDNGFEHHLRSFAEALDDYAAARASELEIEREARAGADAAGDAFEEALERLGTGRPRIAPPGRYGCVALVVSDGASSPGELGGPFAPTVGLGPRGAVSAAALAPDRAARGDNVLSGLFSRIEEGAGGLGGVLDGVMGVWGDLLVSYADASAGLHGLVDDVLGDFGLDGGGTVASWLNERIDAAMRGLGIEPVDLSMRKPVLVDSSRVVARSDVAALADVQSALRSIGATSGDPAAMLEAIGYEVGDYLLSAEIELARIPLPRGGFLPITVRLRDFVEGGEDASRGRGSP